MQMHFEVAEKQANGQVLTQFNTSSGAAEIIHWDVLPEHIPSFIPGTSHVIIRAVENTVIPSIWKGFMGAASNGLSSLTNKINSMFGQQPTQVAPGFEQPSTNKTPFKPTEVHTGVKVIMPRDKVLRLTGHPDCFKNGIILAGGDIVEYSSLSTELSVFMYNMLSTDVTLQRGDPIAFGYFFQVESSMVNTQPKPVQTYATPTPIGRAPTHGINLNK